MNDITTDLERAMYSLVHDHEGGAPALAPLVRMNPGTLANKVNYRMDSHHLTVDEAVQIQLVRRAFPVFEAEARLFGFITVPVPRLRNVSDMQLLDAWADWHADIGETGAEIKKALQDGRITRAEIDAIRREMFEDFQRELELLQRLEALCDE